MKPKWLLPPVMKTAEKLPEPSCRHLCHTVCSTKLINQVRTMNKELHFKNAKLTRQLYEVFLFDKLLVVALLPRYFPNSLGKKIGVLLVTEISFLWVAHSVPLEYLPKQKHANLNIALAEKPRYCV